jgi:hypothetical protein
LIKVNIKFCTGSYNAFSTLDVIVQIEFPGTVRVFVIDLDGRKYESDENNWRETYVSSVLRYINKSTASNDSVDCLRSYSPLSTYGQ